MFCSNCGKTIPETDNRCPACGCPNGEGSFFGSEYTSVQMHIRPNDYERVMKIRTKGVHAAETAYRKSDVEAGAQTGYVQDENTANRAAREVERSMSDARKAYTAEQNTAEEAFAEEPEEETIHYAEYNRDELSDVARETLEDVESVVLEQKVNTAEFEPKAIVPREMEKISDEVDDLIRRLEERSNGKRQKKSGLSLPFLRKNKENAPEAEDEEEYYEDDYVDDGDYVDEEGHGEFADDADYVEQNDDGEEYYDETVGDDDAEYDANEAEDEYAEEEDYAEAGEDNYDDGYEDGYAEEDEYPDEYDDYDYDEAEEPREKKPLNLKRIGIIAAIVVAVLVIALVAVKLVGGKSGGSAIENVDKTLYTQGIQLIKKHRSAENVQSLRDSSGGDVSTLNTALQSSANEINTLLPATPTENELLFISALQKIETDIANSIAADVLTDSQMGATGMSANNWQTVDNAISMLEVAKSGDALNAIISGAVVSKAELEATPTPEPAVNHDMLSKGDSGDEVLKLQNRLYELGYMTDGRDGSYGGKTQTAVKLFQQANGLTVTGVADSETLEMIYDENAKKTAYAPN